MKKGFVAGNFDVIHPGYIKMFNECKDNCDHFTVLLHSDPSIERSDKLKPIFGLGDYDQDVVEQIEIDNHYSGYYAKQEDDIEIFKKDENMKIPENIDYSAISGLSNEIRQKLELIRPKTFGQASRIEGITPAAINLLLTYSKRYNFKHTA